MAEYSRDFLPYDSFDNPHPAPDPRQRANKPLGFGDFLYSATRAFRIGLQNDGNLILWTIDDATLPQDITQGQYTRALWWANTQGSNAHSWVMQADGNFVVYDGENATGNAVWNAATQGNPNAFLRCQDDGNLVIYASNGAAIWNTNTYAGPR
jgi:hypothetical protein